MHADWVSSAAGRSLLLYSKLRDHDYAVSVPYIKGDGAALTMRMCPKRVVVVA